jgi:8-oxo-dGTP pyrophosphatase MutT (NUDIX family)
MNWHPNTTVATIIERDDKFLMVEELVNGKHVFNQPAGHLEDDESLFEAAIRETLEETCWNIELRQFLGLYYYQAPNAITYIRHCFVARAISKDNTKTLDPDIIAAHWLSTEQIFDIDFKARSPIVLKVMEDYLSGIRYPLSLISHHFR